MIFKNNFDPKKTSFQLFAHPHKKFPNFQFITFNNLRKRVIVIPYIRKEYRSPKIYSQVRANQVQIHHLRIFHETSRVRPFSNAPGESRINNRQWNVNDRHVSTTAVPTLWTGGGEERERQSVPRLGPSRGSTGDFDTGIPREVFIHQALVRLTGETGIS